VGSNWQIAAFNATGDTMGKQPQTETHISHVTYARCIIATWSARQYNQCLWVEEKANSVSCYPTCGLW